MRIIPVPLFALSLLAMLLCMSCGGGSGQQAATTAGNVQRSSINDLPLPSQLGMPEATGRTASYVEEDLYRLGKDFDDTLPLQSAYEDLDDVEFAPAWTPGGGTTDLAYCMFSFPVDGYDRTYELHYEFTTAPADWGTMWLGIADWKADSWRWVQCKDTGVEAGAFSADSVRGDGTVVVVFACNANGDSPSLAWVHLGPPLVKASLSTLIKTGVAPVEINASAALSSVPVGSITLYEWDWDGDGTYDEDSGSNPTAPHTYTEPGVHQPVVRVTSSTGVSATAQDEITVIAPWKASWGGEQYDQINDAYRGVDNDLYACGKTNSFGAGINDGVLLRYDLEGNLLWARTTGGAQADELWAVRTDLSGNVYVAGRTYSGGEGQSDVLLQQWDSEGDIVWSKTWGTEHDEIAYDMDLFGSALYIIGTTDAVSTGLDPQQILLAKFDLSGNNIWARAIGGTAGSTGLAIEVTAPLLGSPEVHFTGFTNGTIEGTFAIYGQLDDSGNKVAYRYWQEGHDSIGRDLLVTLLPSRRIMICGDSASDGGGDNALLVEYADTGNPLAKVYGRGGATMTEAHAILGDGDGGFLLAGPLWNATSFVVRTDSNGVAATADTYGASGPNFAVFYGMTLFPGQGLLPFGKTNTANGMPSGQLTLTEGDLTGIWNDLGGLDALTVNGTSSAFASTQNEITEGEENTGSGLDDTLLVAIPMP